MEYFQLANGVTVPKIGFGTYKALDGDGGAVIRAALEAGYRHFDTASFYGNEEALGRAVSGFMEEKGLSRKDFFLTTKVWKEDMGYDAAIRSLEASLKRLGTDYVDLLLIHWPKLGPGDAEWKQRDLDTWKAFEELYAQKKARAVGVSNFLPHHLMNLLERARVKPMVNQLEFHPGYIQNPAVEFCQAEGIAVEAWSPLGRARMLEEPLLLQMAGKYGKSPAQICIRFALQCDVLPLPKSSSPERMKQNLEVFDFSISFEDMSALMTLPQLGWSGEHPDRERAAAG